MRNRLVRYFDRKQCLSSDELADETLTRVARRLDEEGSITEASPAHYCYIVAKFVFLEHLRQVRNEGESEDDADFNSVETSTKPQLAILDQPDAGQKRLECLETCLEALTPTDRQLILEYYQGEQQEKIKHRRELAEKNGLTTNALSIRACRIREKLEKCVKTCSDQS